MTGEDIPSPPMGLPRRLALLTAVMSVLLVLGASEIALSLSERSRLEDFRLESVALANTMATFLTRLAPTGQPDVLAQGLRGWSHRHITETWASVFVLRGDSLVLAASSDTTTVTRPETIDLAALNRRNTEVRFREGDRPAWRVALPLGGQRPYGVLDVTVSTTRLQEWAEDERRRTIPLAVGAALLVALGVAVLTATWVGRPLAQLGRAMAGAHMGAEAGPPAPEIGPPEFRDLARRYNRLREALAQREHETEAQAALLALAERARGFDRLALMQETAASFAHEIGTPLNTLSGHLQLLRDDFAKSRDGRGVDRVSLLLTQVDRMTNIVRIELERGVWPTPAIRRTDLRAVADRMLRFLEPSFRGAGVLVALETGGNGASSVEAACDPELVEQILLNLLKNAIEALSPGGRVTVTTGSTDGRVFLEVADDGPGLAADAQAHLFNPFATTKGPSGTGLGLAVSRRLARTLGGDLEHLPSPRGTRWRLSLPMAGLA